MKLRITLSLKIIFAILLLAACSDISKEQLDFSNYGEAAVAHLSIETLDDWIEISDHILLGEQIASRPYDSYLEYDIQIQEQYKGSVTDSVIQVYSAVPLNEEDKSHLLFLSSNDSEYRENVVYTVVGVPNIIEKDRIKIGPLKDKKVGQLSKTIQMSPSQKVFQDKHQVMESAQNLDELIDFSDYIVHIRPTAIAFENPSLKAVEFELLEKFKGDERFNEKQIIRLPSFIELEQEYLVFYRIYDSERDAVNPGITLTTRHGSVLAKQEDLVWKNAIETLEKRAADSPEE